MCLRRGHWQRFVASAFCVFPTISCIIVFGSPGAALRIAVNRAPTLSSSLGTIVQARAPSSPSPSPFGRDRHTRFRTGLPHRRLIGTAGMSSSTGDEDGGSTAAPVTSLRFVDAGANLLDSMYSGTYHGKDRHNPDLECVLSRAWENGVECIVTLGGTLDESREMLKIAQGDDRLFSTVGIHPTRCGNVFSESSENSESGEASSSDSAEEVIAELIELAERGKRCGTVVAVGECGLDYARTQFCDVETQKRGFVAQLRVAEATNLPLYLHNRESGKDLLQLLEEHRVKWEGAGGIVHSFDESLDVAMKFVDLGLYIGINGCSLRTSENIDVVKNIPLDRLILETDCPWCDVRPTHAGYKFVQTTFPTVKEKNYDPEKCVKNRSEPCHVAQVAEIIAGAKGATVEEVVDICRRNAYALFGGLNKTR